MGGEKPTEAVTKSSTFWRLGGFLDETLHPDTVGTNWLVDLVTWYYKGSVEERYVERLNVGVRKPTNCFSASKTAGQCVGIMDHFPPKLFIQTRYLENKLLLIPLNFIPKSSNPVAKKNGTNSYVFQVL